MLCPWQRRQRLLIRAIYSDYRVCPIYHPITNHSNAQYIILSRILGTKKHQNKYSLKYFLNIIPFSKTGSKLMLSEIFKRTFVPLEGRNVKIYSLTIAILGSIISYKTIGPFTPAYYIILRASIPDKLLRPIQYQSTDSRTTKRPSSLIREKLYLNF